MPQEDVTKNAPDWMKVSGIAEYDNQKAEEDKVNQIEQGNNEAKEKVQSIADDLNIDLDQFRNNAETVLARQNPTSPTGFEDDFVADKQEYDQGFWADAGAGLWNGLVVGGGEGLANLAPTVVQALGVESEFIDDWSTNVSEFFENQKAIYSDAANNEINGFGDINSAIVARALGQGVGFLAGIIGTGGMAGGLSKAGKVLSKYNKIKKGLVAAEATATGAAKVAAAAKLANFTKKSANVYAQANKGQQWASRIGTFMAGTTLMYPEIQKEAKLAGLDNGSAARFALGVSGLVSMTEGVALEWIGKAAARPLTRAVAKKNLKEALLKGGDSPQQMLKIFTENYAKGISKQSIRNRSAIMATGAAIEFGQEFSQTYIEEGAKQLYDTVYKGQDKGEFGADVTTYKSFVESVFGGLIGSVLGGAMASVQVGQGFGDQLTREGLFGYINNSVELNKKDRIVNLKESIDQLVASKKVSKNEGAKAQKIVDELQLFAENVKTSDIKDGVAKYQLFQLDKTRRNADEASSKINPGNTSSPKLNLEAEKKKAMLEKVKAKLDGNFSAIYDSKTSEKSPESSTESSTTSYQKKGLTDGTVSAEVDTKVEDDTQDQVTEEQETKEEVTLPSNKVAFDTKIKMYEQLIVDIAEGKVSEEQLPDMLSRIDSSQAIGTTTGSDVVINGVNIPIAIAEDTDAVNDIKNSFDLVDSGKLSSEDFYKQIQEKYNLTEDQTNQIINEDFVKNYEEIKNKKDGKDKNKKDNDKKDDTKKDKKVLLETTEQKEERLGKLTQREQEIEKEIESLEVTDEQKNLEKELLEAENKVEQAETNSEKAKARKEFIESSK